MLFADIPAQEKVKQELLNMVSNNRLGHAVMLLGKEGFGALPLAIAFAQYIVCEQPTENDACGTCSACLKSKKMQHPDIHFSYPFVRHTKHKEKTLSDHYLPEWRIINNESPFNSYHNWMQQINAENKQGNISMRECHNILKKLSLKSFESDYKVMLLWLPEYLGKEGNTLLKIIEEPPEKTVFILVAQNEAKILNTILSRVQILKVPPLKKEAIEERLIEQGTSGELSFQIAQMCEGSFTRALELKENTDEAYFILFKEWMKLCYTNNLIGLFGWVNSFSRTGRENQKNFLQYLLYFFEGFLVYLFSDKQIVHLNKEEQVQAEKFFAMLDEQSVELINKWVNHAHFSIERNGNSAIVMTNLSIHFRQLWQEIKNRKRA